MPSSPTVSQWHSFNALRLLVKGVRINKWPLIYTFILGKNFNKAMSYLLRILFLLILDPTDLKKKKKKCVLFTNVDLSRSVWRDHDFLPAMTTIVSPTTNNHFASVFNTTNSTLEYVQYNLVIRGISNCSFTYLQLAQLKKSFIKLKQLGKIYFTKMKITRKDKCNICL